MTARHLLTSFLIVVAGCDSTPSELTPEEAMARVASNLVSTTCERDPAQIANADLTPCSEDAHCSTIAGTFCNLETARCDSECDGASRGCEDGETCDCSGHCVATDSVPPPPPVEPPTLTLSTEGIDLAPGAAPQPIDLKVVSTDPRFAPGSTSRPPLAIYLHVDRPAGIEDGALDAIQVSCSNNPADTSQFKSTCGLSAWTFTAVSGVTGQYQASARVFVRRNPAVPVSTTTDVTWDLSVLSDDTDDPHQRVSVAVLSSAVVERKGNYAGTLTFAAEPGTTAPDQHKVSMAVNAYVSEDSKVMLTVKNAYFPYPYIRLTGGGYDQELLKNYPVAIDTPTLNFVYDPRSPRITGKLSISLPLPSVVPTINKLKRTFDFDLTRTGDLTAKKCPCTAAGYVCDQPTGMCFKATVPAPVSGTHEAPDLTKHHAGLATWAAEGRARLGEAIDSLGSIQPAHTPVMLFNEFNGIYGIARRKASGTADLVYDVAGFDLLKNEATDLGYNLCRAYFDVKVSSQFRTGQTCNAGPRASLAQRSEDCPRNYRWVVNNGVGGCVNSSGANAAPATFCASLYDVNRQGFGHTWGPDPVAQCPKTKVADLAVLRRDYAPCVYGKIVLGGDFGDEESVDFNYDHLVDADHDSNHDYELDYSCRSMAKRHAGLKTRPTNAQLASYMATCKSVNTEADLGGGTRGVIFLCPVDDSLVGPYSTDAAAEHLQCLAPTTSTTPNLDSKLQTGAPFLVSGDSACGTAPPADVGLYHFRDTPHEGRNDQTQSSMFWECVRDLERNPTDADTWQDYFAIRKCISPERFLLAMDLKTAALAGADNPGTDGGDAKLVRSLQQWLGVTGFVMTQGMEEMTVTRTVDSSAPTGMLAMTWPRLLELAGQGVALVLDPQVQKMLYRYPDLSKIVGSTGAKDFDRTIALPVSILGAVTTGYKLVETQTNDVRWDVFNECKNGGASQARNDAVNQASKLTRTLAAAEIVAVQLYTSAGSPAWNGTWTKAIDQLSLARERALAGIEDLRACKNPLDIPEDYVPLFFIDAQGANQRYFASSDYLLGQARDLITESKADLQAMRDAWIAQRAGRFQDNMDTNELNRRRDEIKRAAGTVIADLCGSSAGPAERLLDRFESGGADQLTQANCYYEATPECRGADRPVSCYRGVLGEAAAGVIGAYQDVDLASANWTDLQAKFDLRNRQCARIQKELTGNDALMEQHKIHMDQLRKTRRGLERVKTAFGAAYSSVAMWFTDVGPFAHEVVWGRVLGKMDEEMAQAEVDFQFEMSKRITDQRIQACYDEVDALKIGIDTAYQVISRRNHDAQAAMARFSTAQAKLRFTALDAKNALDRENGREYLAIGHHHWLPEKKARFLTNFNAAKRVAYLALLALEWDAQQSLVGRDRILAARTPADLEAVVGSAATVGLGNFTRNVHGQPPEQPPPAVASLTEILGFAPANADEATAKEATRRLRAFLTSPEAAIYNSVTGEYMGQGIRFNLSNLHLSQRCGERIWRVAASVQGKQTPTTFTTAILYKDRNFATTDCVTQDFRRGTTRDEIGKLVPRLANKTAKATVKAQLTGKMGLTRTQLLEAVSGGDYPGSSNELRLMGVYGDYTLLFPVESLVDLKLGELDDVLFRFDLLSAGDVQE